MNGLAGIRSNEIFERTLMMQEIVLNIIRNTNSRIESSSLDPTRSLLDQGLDSLDLLTVYTKLEQEAGVDIQVDRIGEMVTVNQMIDYLKSAEDDPV